MYFITYSLKNSKGQSDEFYQKLDAFTDEVVLEIHRMTLAVTEDYISHLKANGGSRLCSLDEHGFELLVLGTLWEIYSGDAGSLGEVPAQLLSGLAKLRRQGGIMKPGFDFIRGIMSTIFMSPDLYDHMFKLDISLDHLDKLLNWLDASGEFNQEVIRLRRWERYLHTLPEDTAKDILASAITLAGWFQSRSEEVLGGYTENVDRYLNEVRPERYWREDVIFCGRRRVEYHLNMVGAGIMNRIYRDGFVKTAEKAVLIPACMRRLPTDECRGRTDEEGFHCAGCTAECSVFKLMQLGRKNGFAVHVLSHESSISKNRQQPEYLNSKTGVVGVACVLNLISGGWLLDSMGISAQCVLLDYCGCKNHWSREGIPTEINEAQLLQVLGLQSGCKPE
jgi:hypothetical protein